MLGEKQLNYLIRLFSCLDNAAICAFIYNLIEIL